MASNLNKNESQVQPDLTKTSLTIRLQDLGIPIDAQHKIIGVNKGVNELIKDKGPENGKIYWLATKFETMTFRNQVINPINKGKAMIKVFFLILGIASPL